MPLENSALRVLAAIIAEDLQALKRPDGALDKFSVGIADSAWDNADLWASAGVLHGIYNAVENTFWRISQTLGETLDRSERWHAELLHVMLLEVPQLRPAVVPDRLRPLLRELLAFRHLYRHGYDLQLDGAKLGTLVDHWKKDRGDLFAAFAAFQERLLRQAERLPE
jgi:hypothetical protein